MELGPKRWNWGQNDGIDLAKPMESGQKIGHMTFDFKFELYQKSVTTVF